ncbi:Hypothetical_protein [Hexamita inflata]|uniref:Hypothetical_protein n=1 Tax=Hexamita inflata TaxID=28002 RepID=A0ABP1HDS9_9EUKA
MKEDQYEKERLINKLEGKTLYKIRHYEDNDSNSRQRKLARTFLKQDKTEYYLSRLREPVQTNVLTIQNTGFRGQLTYGIYSRIKENTFVSVFFPLPKFCLKTKISQYEQGSRQITNLQERQKSYTKTYMVLIQDNSY